MAANTHPDHDTLATFRRRFLKKVEAPFVHSKVGHQAFDPRFVKG